MQTIVKGCTLHNTCNTTPRSNHNSGNPMLLALKVALSPLTNPGGVPPPIKTHGLRMKVAERLKETHVSTLAPQVELLPKSVSMVIETKSTAMLVLHIILER